MAATRYGVIVHATHRRQYVRFENVKARAAFEEKFDAYHASHDHDGDAPIFLDATTADLPTANVAVTLPFPSEMTIDGYVAHEIEEYHRARENSYNYTTYQPPTCCVPPLVALNNQFEDLIGADTFKRHELSASFQDMPDDNFLSLIESIATKGIFDNIIKIYEGQILDGWHRYRACQELGILRKLRFQVWDTERDGDALDFAIAQNLDRRQLTPSQIAQIVLDLAERYGHGGDRSKGSSRDLETLEALAKKGNVSVSTMKRASAVQKLGDAEVEAVKTGKVAATKVLADAKERRAACKRELTNRLKRDLVLELEIDEIPALAEKYQIPRRDVELMITQVVNAEVIKARDRWQKAYTKVRTNWMDYEALSKNVEWEAFTAVAIEQTDIAFLSQETFTDSDNRIKSCNDYKTLQIEGSCLQTLAVHLHNPSTWVSNLIPQAVRDEYECKALWEKIDARLPQWKKRLPVENQVVPVEDFTKDLLITVFREHLTNNSVIKIEIGKPGSPLSLAELKEFYDVIRNENYPIIYAVRKALLGDTEQLPLQEALNEMKATSEQPQIPEVRHQLYKARETMLNAFHDSLLTPDRKHPASRYALSDFEEKVEARFPSLTLDEYPDLSDEGAHHVQIVYYQQITADIENQTPWFLAVMEAAAAKTLDTLRKRTEQTRRALWDAFHDLDFEYPDADALPHEQEDDESFAIASTHIYPLFDEEGDPWIYTCGQDEIKMLQIDRCREIYTTLLAIKSDIEKKADWVTAWIASFTGVQETEQTDTCLTKVVVWYADAQYITFGGDHPTKPLEALPLLVRTLLEDIVKESEGDSTDG